MMTKKKIIKPFKKVKYGDTSGWKFGDLVFLSKDKKWLKKFKDLAFGEMYNVKERKKK